MALINHAKREINAKIVYYGREGAGKRSSLQYIYDRIKPSLRGELKSPSGSGDSLFFFDFSPFENPVFDTYRIRFHVYTLPGKVANPAAWKMTLKGADGLVIVADASPEQENDARESISTLRDFLAAYGVGFHDIPCVLQLTKSNRSLHSSAAEMAAALDLTHIRVCLSDTASGEGVLETLSLLSREIMTRIGQDDALRAPECGVTPAGALEDTEEFTALLAGDKDSAGSVNESIQVHEDTAVKPSAGPEEERELLQVVLAGEGAVCHEGVVRVPLEFTFAGTTRRLVVSIAIDQV
jgi:signal recognition particle receptor subunit beta